MKGIVIRDGLQLPFSALSACNIPARQDREQQRFDNCLDKSRNRSTSQHLAGVKILALDNRRRDKVSMERMEGERARPPGGLMLRVSWIGQTERLFPPVPLVFP